MHIKEQRLQTTGIFVVSPPAPLVCRPHFFQTDTSPSPPSTETLCSSSSLPSAGHSVHPALQPSGRPPPCWHVEINKMSYSLIIYSLPTEIETVVSLYSFYVFFSPNLLKPTRLDVQVECFVDHISACSL